VHDINSPIGPEKTKEFLSFHAFTGCDIVSVFTGKGRRFMADMRGVSRGSSRICETKQIQINSGRPCLEDP